MKQLWIIALVCALGFAAGCGQVAVTEEVTDTDAQPAEQKPIIERVEIPDELAAHPRIFLTPDRITELKTAIANDAWLKDYTDTFIAECEAKIDGYEVPTMESGEGGNGTAGSDARDFALAYVLSDNMDLADAAADILRAFVPLYPQYEVTYMKGRAMSATLGEAEWGRNMACAYDLIYNSGALSDADKTAIEDDVLRPCGQVLADGNHRYRSNWRAAGMSGAGVIGLAIDDRDLIEEGLNGYRNEEGELFRDGMSHHISFAVLSDGIGYERSQSYHSYSMYSYVWLMEAATNSGIDMWNLEFTGHDYDSGADPTRSFGDTGPKTLKAMFEAPMYYAFSNGEFATIANCGSMKLDRSGHGWCYEAAYRAYGDKRFAWRAQQTDLPHRVGAPHELMFMDLDMVEGEFDLTEDVDFGMTGKHRNLCSFFPAGGYAILRDSTEDDALNVNMTFGKYGSGHSHPDKLSIMLQINEKPVVVDLKLGGYGGDLYGGFTKQTMTHNTVVVDEIAQAPQGDTDYAWAVDESVHGEPVLFYATDEIKAARARSTTVYEGVVVDRTLVMVDSMLIDIYRCRSEDEHQYDYVLHINGELDVDTLPNAEAIEGALGEKFGYRLYDNVVQGNAPAGETIQYTTVADVTMNLHPILTDEGTVLTADGPVSKYATHNSAILFRESGTDVNFVNVMTFGDDPADMSVDATSDDEGNVTVMIVRDGEVLTLVSTEACNVTVVDNDTVLADEDRPLIFTRE
jgi:hypothetical protein